MSQDGSRAARALFRLRGMVESGAGTSSEVFLERLAACAREATGAASATVVREDDPGPLPIEAGVLLVPFSGAQGRRAGHFRLEVGGDRPPDHLSIEVASLCAAQATSRLLAEARAEARRREESRRAAVHAVVHASLQHPDLDDMLRDAVDALRRGVRCQGVWIRAFDSPHDSSLRRYAASYPTWADTLATDELLDISARAARRCWDLQQVSSLHLDHLDAEPVTIVEERDFMFDFMRSIEAQALLMAPLGGAGECQGFIALTRTTVDEAFDADDEATVMTIGRELGAAVAFARLLEQQRDLVGQLQDLDAYKNRFIATVAHQLKSPLTSIVGHIEVLEDLGEGDDGVRAQQERRSLTTMQRSAERIRETVDALLTLSKVQDADRPFVPGEVRLGRLVEDCVDLFSVSARERRITLDLDRAHLDLAAWGVREELEEVVDNLIGNAVKYSPDGSVVSLAVAPEGEELVFTCRDQGYGIAEQELGRLFDPFYRSEDPRMLEVPGTGLGMSIVKAVLDRHGGRIEVESTLGAGSTFRVRLPRAPVPEGLLD